MGGEKGGWGRGCGGKRVGGEEGVVGRGGCVGGGSVTLVVSMVVWGWLCGGDNSGSLLVSVV